MVRVMVRVRVRVKHLWPRVGRASQGGSRQPLVVVVVVGVVGVVVVAVVVAVVVVVFAVHDAMRPLLHIDSVEVYYTDDTSNRNTTQYTDPVDAPYNDEHVLFLDMEKENVNGIIGSGIRSMKVVKVTQDPKKCWMKKNPCFCSDCMLGNSADCDYQDEFGSYQETSMTGGPLLSVEELKKLNQFYKGDVIPNTPVIIAIESQLQAEEANHDPLLLGVQCCRPVWNSGKKLYVQQVGENREEEIKKGEPVMQVVWLKKQHEEGDKTIYVVGEVDRNIDQNLTIVPLRVIISPITSSSDVPRNADRTTLIKCDLKSIEIHQGDNTTRQITYEILTEHLNYMKSLL